MPDMIEFNGKKMPAKYIGDGVYAIYDGFSVWLHANDLNNPSDRICLEPLVIKSLNNFFEDITK